jgi:glycosyltransferase involved in cell wall biosynthesis
MQTIKNIDKSEIILIDSYSSDDTVDIAKSYPIRIIGMRPSWKLSPSAARFTGTNYACGEYLLFMDGDMELVNGWAEEAIGFLEANNDVAAVMGKQYDIYVTADGERSEPHVSRDGKGLKYERQVSYVFQSAVFRRKYLVEAGGFHPFLRAEEEAELSWRLKKLGYKLYYLPYDSIYHYSIPRKTFKETTRRIRNNLWQGMGDTFSWVLYNGEFGVIWDRFMPYIVYTILAVCITTGIFINSGNSRIVFTVLACLLFIGISIKKGSVHQAVLSLINISVISLCLIGGVFRKIPAIDKYPKDAIAVK